MQSLTLPALSNQHHLRSHVQKSIQTGLIFERAWLWEGGCSSLSVLQTPLCCLQTGTQTLETPDTTCHSWKWRPPLRRQSAEGTNKRRRTTLTATWRFDRAGITGPPPAEMVLFCFTYHVRSPEKPFWSLSKALPLLLATYYPSHWHWPHDWKQDRREQETVGNR